MIRSYNFRWLVVAVSIAGLLTVAPPTYANAAPRSTVRSDVELHATGMTYLNKSHASTAAAAVNAYFAAHGVRNTRPLKCFNVFWANSNHAWIYQSFSGYADRHSSVCHPADGHQVVQHKVNGRWREVAVIGTGLSSGDCRSIVRRLTTAGASARTIRDIRTRVDFGPC